MTSDYLLQKEILLFRFSFCFQSMDDMYQQFFIMQTQVATSYQIY